MKATREQRIEIEKLLPFLVNGTLSDAERELVEKAVANDDELRQEIALLEFIRTEIRSQVPVDAPGEIGLARLHRDIVARKRRDRPLSRAISQFGLLAAAAVLAVFGATSLFVWQHSGPVYTQASGEEPDAVLTVAFQPAATEEQISRLLSEYGLIIVDGPSSLRLYRLGFEGADDLETIAASLRARTDIFEFVEDPR